MIIVIIITILINCFSNPKMGKGSPTAAKRKVGLIMELKINKHASEYKGLKNQVFIFKSFSGGHDIFLP